MSTAEALLMTRGGSPMAHRLPRLSGNGSAPEPQPEESLPRGAPMSFRRKTTTAKTPFLNGLEHVSQVRALAETQQVTGPQATNGDVMSGSTTRDKTALIRRRRTFHSTSTELNTPASVPSSLTSSNSRAGKRLDSDMKQPRATRTDGRTANTTGYEIMDIALEDVVVGSPFDGKRATSERLPVLAGSEAGGSVFGSKQPSSCFSIQIPSSSSNLVPSSTHSARTPGSARSTSCGPNRRSALQRSKSQMKLLSPSVIRIVANGHLVKHEELKAMKEVFDRLDKTRSGYVEYSRLAEGNGRTLFSQNLMKHVSTAAEDDDPDRPQGVFSFRDMLAISYPLASPEELNEMEDFATKGSSIDRLRKARENATPRERLEAEEWFREISEDSDGLIFLDSLEDFLNANCPFMNVYQYLKTMEPPILERLYDDEPMTKDEFLYWHLTNAAAQRTAEENLKRVKQGYAAPKKAQSGGMLKQLRRGRR